ncbi:MAG: 4,5-DOPA dioxygenase extradiol, partial [Candidatus Aminicenantales bacterium]
MTDDPAASQKAKTHPGVRMPVLFIGHGSPMNAIEDSVFSRGWREMVRFLPKPEAILCVSAHWETEGPLATAMEEPPTIHDFGGFPEALYEMRYPAPGNPSLAGEVKKMGRTTAIGLDREWGLDHGCWCVLCRMFPRADVPVVQLSLARRLSPAGHYALAARLSPLRRKGVLILASGNIVHNLRRVVLRGDDFNEPFGLDWALEASAKIKALIRENRHEELIAYGRLGSSVALAVPTPEHYLPLLYALALKEEDEHVAFFNDQAVAGSL